MKRNAPHSDAWNAQAPEREPWQEPDQFSGETPERAGGGSARLVPLVICAILLVVLLVEGVFIWGKSAQMQRNNAVYVPSAEQNVYPADESFSFGPLQRAMKVSGQGEDMGRITGAAQDEKIVRVALSMGAVNDTVWDCSGAFYLQCGGTYYPNLGGYQLEQEHPEWAMRALNGYELCESGMEEGWVYFLVPESVSESTFWMHWLEKDEDYNNESVQAAGVPVSFAQEVAGND